MLMSDAAVKKQSRNCPKRKELQFLLFDSESFSVNSAGSGSGCQGIVAFCHFHPAVQGTARFPAFHRASLTHSALFIIISARLAPGFFLSAAILSGLRIVAAEPEIA